MPSRFRPYRRLERFNVLIAIPLAAMMGPMPIVAQQVGPVVAPNSGNTRVYTGGGGVPIVDIATANGAGLSHNKFTSYDVPTQGLVLNNAAPSQFTTTSQLAGTITTNFNLKDQATVILNEVVAPNASTIAGFTEVVGGKADVVVANPYGIAVKGGGFINTNQVTLATGTPLINASGALTGLHVTGGELSISGDGLNGTGIPLVNLLARAVKIGGQVNATDLLVAVGANDFDYASRTVKANGAATGTTPQYAIDSSALGGMYANRIRLIATDAGVGVRMLGDVAATADDLTVTSAGKVELSNKTYAERDVAITSVGMAVAGGNASVTAKRDVTFDAGAGALAMSEASLVAGKNLSLTAASLSDTTATPQTAANRFAIGTVTVNVGGNATVSGSNYGAGSAVNFTAGAIDLGNLASLYSGADSTAANRGLSLRATSGDLTLGNGQLTSPTTISLRADLGNVTIAASGSGTGVEAATDLVITAKQSVTTAGNLTAGSNLSVDATGVVTNDGKLIAGNALTIGNAAATLALNNSVAGVIGGKSVSVQAAALTNAGAVQGAQSVTVNVSGLLTNAANALVLTAGEADRAVSVSAGALNNAGFLQSTGALTVLVAGDATNSGVIATQSTSEGGADRAVGFTSSTLNNSGTLQSAGQLALTAKQGNGSALTNSGTLQSVGDATYVVGGGLSQAGSGAILGGGAVSVQSGQAGFSVANSGRIQAAQGLQIGAGNARAAVTQSTGAVIMAGGDTTFEASTIDNHGTVQAGGALVVDASGAVANAADGVVLTTANANKAITISATSLTNAGNVQATGAVTATLSGAFDNTGVINATGVAAISAQQLTNEKGAVLASSDALTMKGGTLTNAGLVQSAISISAALSGNVTNTSDGVILTAGNATAPITLRGDAVANAGTISSTGALKVDASTISNTGSQIARGEFDLSVASSLTNSGLLQASGKLDVLTPAQLQNTASGRILGGADVFLSGRQGWTMVNDGRVQAAGTLNIGNGDRVTLTNEGADGALFAGTTLSLNAVSIANSALMRGTTGAGLDVLNGLTNSAPGVLATSGQPGAQISINAGVLTNAGAVQSAGGINANVAGALTNSGNVITQAAAAGGSDGAIAIHTGVFSNSGNVQSANYFSVLAEDGSGTSFSNNGVVTAADAVRIWAPASQSNSGIISAGGQLVMVSPTGPFALTNAAGAYIQAGSEMAIGDATNRVTLTNDGYILTRGGLVTRANTITNNGVLQALYRIDAQATGAVVNHGTASNGAGPVTLGSESLTNTGNVQVTDGVLTVNTTGSTTNSGTILSNGQYAGNISLGADNVTNTNTGNITSGASLGVVTNGSAGTTFSNSGNVTATNDITLTTNHGAVNGTTGFVSAGGNVTLTSGNGSFTVTNGGVVQAGGNLTIGKTGQPVALTNQGNAVLLALGNLAVTGSTVTNSGRINGQKAVDLTLTGALTNNASGVILAGNTSMPATAANVTITAASITNAGNVNATGSITGTASGAISNTGTVFAGIGNVALPRNLSLTLTGNTITNAAVVQSSGTLTLVATAPSGTTVANTGTIQSEGNISITSPGQLSNQGKILGNASVVISAGSTAFSLLNDGRIQSAENMILGATSGRVAITNSVTGVVQAGGTLTGYASTVSNSNLIQSVGALVLTATGTLTNSSTGNIVTVGLTPASLKLEGTSLTNDGNIVSSGSLTIERTPATGATVVNTGLIQSAADLTGVVSATGLSNSATGRIISGGSLLLTSDAGTFVVTNSDLIQATGNLTIGVNSHRATLTNAAAASILVGGTSQLFDTTVTNNGTLQSGGALTIDATGAVSNNSGAKLLTTGQGSALSITAASLTNATTLQSTGNLTVTVSGALNNSATLSTVGDAAGALKATAGAEVTNTGTISSAGTLSLTAGTTLTNDTSAVIKSTGAAALKTGTALTNATGAKIASDDSLTITGSSPFILTNNGVVQSGAATTIGSATNRVGFTNANGASLLAGGSLTMYSTGLTNSGTLQAGDDSIVVLTAGSTVTNAAGAKILSATGLTIDTATAGGFTLTNNGNITTLDGQLKLGGTGSVTLTNAAAAKIMADSFAITAGAVENYGRLAAAHGGTLTASSFYNHASTSKFIGSTDTGATTVTISGALTNEGAIFGADDMTLSAANISISDTAGISSQANLTLHATSTDLINNGALYAGGKLTATAVGLIKNTLTGTIDTDGDFAVTADTFYNQNQINIGGTGTITVNTFKNVMVGAENLTRVSFQPGSETQFNYIDQGSSEPAVNNIATTKWYYTGHGGYDYPSGLTHLFDDRHSEVYGFYYNKQYFSGISDADSYFAGKIKPQINATNLTITGFNNGQNIGAVISGTGNVTINGSGSGSSFTNDALNLNLTKYNYQGTWWYQYTTGSYDWWNPTGDSGGQHITDVLQTVGYSRDYFTVGSGIQAGHLSFTNVGTLTNLGSTNSPHVDAAPTQTAGADAAESSIAISVPIAASAAGFTTAAITTAASMDDLAVGQSVTSGQLAAFSISAKSAAGAKSITTASAANAGSSQSGGQLLGGRHLNPFAAISAADFAKALKNAKLTFGNLSLKLPTNPNGYFVTNADPTAKYIVATNEDFGIDTSNLMGSDFFKEKLGGTSSTNPVLEEKRLGDPAYEAYLVRQQLVDQLGTRLLAGEKSEADQMQRLMQNGVDEASRLGLVFGQAPSASQLANLDHDMVWMIDQVIGGEHVLVPQVFVSAKTKSMFDPKAASFAADTMDMDVGSLTNTGGTIGASGSLSIKTKGDVTNTSGSITGGKVSIDAGGSIVNQTTVVSSKDGAIAGTTAKIGASGDLDLKAKDDIKVIGADLKAGGNASLDAGKQIVVDTIQTKTTSRETESMNLGFYGTQKSTTTTDVKNQSSNLDFGGNLKLKSGGDTTLAGAKVNVKGDLDTDVGGSLNVLARQDQHTVSTKEDTSGIGVNGGLYGTDKKETTDFTGTNFGTTLNVGGNATIKAKKDITLEGADVDIKGDGSIDATNVNILDGKDEHRVTTKESKTTVGVFTDSDSSAGANAKAKSGGYSATADTDKGGKTTTGSVRLSGEASANAHAEGSGSATIGVRTQDTDSMDYTSKSRSTNLKIGGNASIKAKETLTVRGSNLESGGDMNLDAKDQQFLAGQDIHYSTESDKTMTVGMKYSGEGSAEAGAKAKAGPGAISGNAKAEAKGEVGAGFSYEDEKTNSSSYESKAHVSTIKSGGNLTRTAKNSITDVGTDIDVGGDLNQSAKTITSLAAHDIKSESSDSTKNSVGIGVYADAHAGASAKGSAGAGTGVDYGAEASAGVSAGGQIKFDRETSDSTKNSDTAVVSNIKVKGKMNSTSTDKTVLEGTNIDAKGDVTLSAKSLDYRAAVSTESESSNSSKLGIDLKGGVGAGASASTKGEADAGYGPQGSLGVNYGKKKDDSSSRDEEGGKLSSGGKITIKTADDAHFVGTEIESKEKTKISAGGSVTYDATHSTKTSSGSDLDVGVDLAGGKTGKGKSAELGVDVGYGKSKSSSDKAKAGSISADGGLDISAGKNATFEGTDLSSNDGDIRVSAKQDVTFKQATSTSSSNDLSLTVGASMEGSMKGEKGSSDGKVEKKAGLDLGVGYNNSDKTTAKTSKLKSGGAITIESGGDTTLQGTKLDSKGDTNVNAGGNLNLTAKQESSTAMDLSASLGGSTGLKGDSKGGESKDTSKKTAKGGFDIGGEASAKETGGTISSGGKVNLNAGKNINTVGTQVDAKSDINVSAGGKVNERDARSASIGGAFGAQGLASTSTTTTTKDGSASSKQTDKAGADVTDLGFSAHSDAQKATLKSTGGGKVNVTNGAKGPDVSNAGKPLPDDPESKLESPKTETSPIKTGASIKLNTGSIPVNATPSDGPGQAPKSVSISAKPATTNTSIAVNIAPSDGPGQAPTTVATPARPGATSVAVNIAPSDGPGQAPKTVPAPAKPRSTSIAIDTMPSDGPGQVPTTVAAPGRPAGTSIAIDAKPSDGPGQVPKTVAAPARPGATSIPVNVAPSDGPGQNPTPAPAAPSKP